MTVQTTEIPSSLVNRVCERAARSHSAAELPSIVLDEMQAAAQQIPEESRLEHAKRLLLLAWRWSGFDTDDTETADEARVSRLRLLRHSTRPNVC